MGRVILDNVVKRYRDVVAVDHVSLTVEEGEFVALVGPSGCGKTTTLNLIAGLLELSEGNIYIGERLVNDLDPKDRDIAMVFQNYALYPNKTVYKNLAFPLQMRKTPKDQIDQRVRETARLLSIEPLLERRPKELSGGQQQRVALGRALVRNPQVFLMDEPLSNLDAKLRVQMRAELKRFHQDINATIVYVTHDQLEAVTMADKMAVMSGGLLQQYDAPDIVYNQPVNTFVAGFVGSPAMNLLSATVEVDGDTTWLRNGNDWASALDAKRGAIAQSASTDAVIAGLRHNAIHLSPTETPGAIPVRIYTVEPTGDLTFVHGYLGDLLIVASVPPGTQMHPDDIVWATFDLDQMHLFDGVTQMALASEA
ncbi:MAG: ABC transporter ATP-binding protein [Thermomicrobiales bacterium]|nr:ABC transporter ATP-binding protein [Thermomicrobiales bacterium]